MSPHCFGEIVLASGRVACFLCFFSFFFAVRGSGRLFLLDLLRVLLSLSCVHNSLHLMLCSDLPPPPVLF